MACVRSASGRFQRRASRRSPGLAIVEIAKSGNFQPLDGTRDRYPTLGGPGRSAEIRARFMSELSTHTHECPRCGAQWQCGEANYQDECPYPIKTICTKCWAKGTPKRGTTEGTRSFR